MKVMLHACCGPCLLEPLDALTVDHEVRVAFANPNIHPLAEYVRRRDVMMEYAAGRGIEVDELEYDIEAWESAVGVFGGDVERRCVACFRLRLGMTADLASRSGCDAVATTLTVSPYQDHDAIRRAGEAACSEAGVRFLVTDYRSLYPASVRRSRELGMYRQNYCGCRFSLWEARDARERRLAARADTREGGGEAG